MALVGREILGLAGILGDVIFRSRICLAGAGLGFHGGLVLRFGARSGLVFCRQIGRRAEVSLLQLGVQVNDRDDRDGDRGDGRGDYRVPAHV